MYVTVKYPNIRKNRKNMKVIQVYHPLQDERSRHQLIDGEYPNWCVVTEQLKTGQSYQEWILKKKEHCEKHGIPGIYLYDISALTVAYIETTVSVLRIRYAYIGNNVKTNMVTKLIDAANVIKKSRVGLANHVIISKSYIQDMADSHGLSFDEMSEIIKKDLTPQ